MITALSSLEAAGLDEISLEFHQQAGAKVSEWLLNPETIRNGNMLLLGNVNSGHSIKLDKLCDCGADV